ncbi:cytochrome P450 [Calocera viscosa TUFC12733]|uniref:Cytochrome P450 n=1 Tax=Calocera viscosa (strain TUFC12733) TaxID=1330018 RepID=A0A167P045_CALVF|nr:cytochrome P450 [Calocera viscosa TUFC12733]
MGLVLISRKALYLLLALVAGWVLYNVAQVVRHLHSPLRVLPGPHTDTRLFGILPNSLKNASKEHRFAKKWTEKYGRTFAFRLFGGTYRLYTTDTRAVAHMLSHTDIYPKSDHLRTVLVATIGEGLLVAEGEVHKRQRRIMNPSFSPGQIREVTPIFFDTAYQLRNVINALLAKAPTSGALEVEMYGWVGRAALDIIGQAGFGYRFNALYDESNELFRAFHDMFYAMGKAGIFGYLQNRFWLLKLIPTRLGRLVKQSIATTRRVGMELVSAKKLEVQNELHSKNIEKSRIVGRDLLSALIRANMADDLAPAHRMSDEEVLAQISTFIAAGCLQGHETTASGLSWTLLSLAQHPDVQSKLRAELSLVADETPSMDDLNALPYLDMVVKESLRFNSPVTATHRIAIQADVIPLLHPVVDRNGVVRDTVHVQAGDLVGIQILAMNKSKELWGEDAEEFRPERWAEEAQEARNIPGVWAHIMSFLGGPRACIGYRFSVIESKALLFALIREFEFAPVPGIEIGGKSAIVYRPNVKGRESEGQQMPLIVKRVARSA